MELTGYYRRFVKNYGKIVALLTHLLKKDGFRWTEAATLAMNELKKAMKEVPTLALPNFKEMLVLETDASRFGLEAVLSQKGRPIAFFSKALGEKGWFKSV